MQTIHYYLTHRDVLADVMMSYLFRWLPDKSYLKLQFHRKMGYKLNLKNPKTFSEKLQWLKLYDRRPEYTVMVDKVRAKEYVASKLGEDYIIPTLGVWDDPDKIDFDLLPDRFVLKCNHNSGRGMYICKDKSKIDIEKVKAELRKGLKENYYLKNREWPYKDVPRRILAEKFIDPRPGIKDLPDYKLFCFNGEVKAVYVATDRQKQGEQLKLDFFDADFNHLPIRQSHANAAVTPEKPRFFEMMKQAAEQLSKGIPHVRIDFYEIEDGVLFGEMTFFSFSGLLPYQPEEFDKQLGDMLVLPGENRGGVIIKQLQNGDLDFSTLDLKDYKFFCFDGEVKALFIASDRSKGEHAVRFDFFDENFNHLPFTNGHPNADVLPAKPKMFEEMKALASKLSKGIPHIRIDFYEVGDKVYFGEMTFFHWSGLMPYYPVEWDYKFGSWIKMPTNKM